MRRTDSLRRLVNDVTLATPLGLVLAATGRARLCPGPHGTVLALGYRSPFPAPRASAVTIGDVVLLRMDADQLARRPGLLAHELRHTRQWAALLGVVGFPLAYGLASAWSWLRVRDAATANPFEVWAGLVDGGYLAPAGQAPGGQARGGQARGGRVRGGRVRGGRVRGRQAPPA